MAATSSLCILEKAVNGNGRSLRLEALPVSLYGRQSSVIVHLFFFVAGRVLTDTFKNISLTVVSAQDCMLKVKVKVKVLPITGH